MHKELDINLLEDIASEIAAIKPFDDLEDSHRQNSLNWVLQGDNIFRIKKPDIPPKHLVSYFVLVDTEHKSILLVDHIKAQLWLPPGGHVKFNEHPAVAVERESIEEFKIQAQFLKNNRKPFFITSTVTVGLTPGHTDVSLWYLLKSSVHDRFWYDKSEFLDIEWYTIDEILESDPVIFDPHLQRFARKLASLLQK